jgi:phosphoribosyl 1,2-cyclic phosphodiesterase
VDRGWHHIHAVLLTHTHGDHWKERTLAHLGKLGIPFYCHGDHHLSLRQNSGAFVELRSSNLIRGYEPMQTLQLSPTLTCTPLPLLHDETTYGFRFDAKHQALDADGDGNCQSSTLGYAADLGCWQPALVDAFADVDILALEFNHDVFLERNSRRSPELIARVLGDRGHLSNVQAAALLRKVLERSRPGRPQHVVQLHLSRQCNRPAMAADAARVILKETGAKVTVHTAVQERAGPSLTIGEEPRSESRRTVRRQKVTRTHSQRARHVQPLLPGWEV